MSTSKKRYACRHATAPHTSQELSNLLSVHVPNNSAGPEGNVIPRTPNKRTRWFHTRSPGQVTCPSRFPQPLPQPLPQVLPQQLPQPLCQTDEPLGSALLRQAPTALRGKTLSFGALRHLCVHWRAQVSEAEVGRPTAA